MQLPECVSLLLISALQVRHLDILLILHSVHIFVELVQKLSEELGTIMLVVPLKHYIMLAKSFLKLARIHVAIAARLVPHLEVQLGQLGHDFAFGTERVLQIDLISEAHRKQVLAEALEVRQALQRAIHVARVAQVVQADGTIRRVQLHLSVADLTHVDAFQSQRTVGLVVGLVG